MDADTKKITDINNPLLSAAEKLLLIATQLCQQNETPQLSKLYNTICDEIAIFEAQSIKAGFSKTTVNQARFLLCALIDEIILTSNWDTENSWKERSLTNTFQKNTPSESHFFQILKQAEEVPEEHLDLLELGYTCLRLGYQGIYHNDQTELINFTEQLYNTIQHERSEVDTNKEVLPRYLPPIWLTILIAFILLLAIFIPYNKKLNKDALPVLQTIQQISTSDT